MKTSFSIPLLFAVGLVASAFAQESQRAPAEHRLGQHPAVIVKKLAEKQPYDYVSKFYPHPAWLYLLPEAPASNDLPANLAARGKPGDAVDNGNAAMPAKARP
jgi:hypothetical protein